MKIKNLEVHLSYFEEIKMNFGSFIYNYFWNQKVSENTIQPVVLFTSNLIPLSLSPE